ncbi:MAG: hypothetical protein RL732_98 [Bacteroidota bacterium]|jgi:hypothetical protein
MKPFFFLLAFSGLFLYSCSKQGFITGPDAFIDISDDTLQFDTVFVTVGSTTQYFRIYNLNDQKLRLSSVKLMGGTSSFFKMNVDGFSGNEITDLEIEPNDSLYAFVTVAIDPNAQSLPFVVRDSIQISFNGNKEYVQLEAWGKNAHFLRNHFITQKNETWTNDLPYVILGGVLVDQNASLTINQGTKVYLHADAPLIVDGTLIVKGEAFDSTRVVFQGDRLDEPYKNFPAGWPGIYFSENSKNNVLEYAVIKNAYQGLIVNQPAVNGQPKLTLRSCIIDNCYDAGILGLRSQIIAENCLISNCGKNLLLAYGGDYQFTHCTGASFANPYLEHKDPVLFVSDFIKNNNNTISTAPLNATFTNCIFWGDYGTVENEVAVSKQGGNFQVNFKNCIWKVKTEPANCTVANILSNQYPLFDSINTSKRYFNFRLREGSPALDKGIATGLVLDLDGKPRAKGLPDLGCYERQP